ncbi:MAG: cell wall hydrolase, partial [Lachnospiraceae bacterium]|nr:cell wall hydrolase [Lachnospiraceae bacterium]
GEKTVNEKEKAIKEGEKTVNKEKKTVRQEKKAAKTASSIPQVRLNDADYECLLKIVQSEAGICDQKGKILVANVILNRMKNQDFPDTVTAVVYQKNQFSPVENGAIDRVCITEETKEAVSMALSGTDYSKGALFFAARKLAGRENMKWFDESLEFLFEHDGHEFFTLKTNIQS